MNKVFAARCADPVYFESIKYAVHSLDGTLFYDKVIEILDINPYLATLCYVTSEYNKDLEWSITHHLRIAQNESISTRTRTLVCLSYGLLGLKQDFVKAFPRLRTKKRKGDKLPELYYINLLYEALIKYQAVQQLVNINQVYPDLLSNEDEEQLLDQLFAGYGSALSSAFYIVERLSLYGLIKSNKEERYMSRLPKILKKLYENEKLWIPNSDKATQCAAGRKLLTMYILFDDSQTEAGYDATEGRYYNIKAILYSKKKQEKPNVLALMMEEYFKTFSMDNIYSAYDVPDGYIWDVEKNGINKPYKAYFDEKTLAWWTTTKGKSVKHTINSINGINTGDQLHSTKKAKVSKAFIDEPPLGMRKKAKKSSSRPLGDEISVALDKLKKAYYEGE